MGEAADFFVSYTSADRAWAEWIAWQLEAEGYQVVVQAWDFTAGRDWAHEMQQATATAERVVRGAIGCLPAFGAWGGGVAGVLRQGSQRGARLLLPVRVERGRAARPAQDQDLCGPGRPGRGRRPAGAAGRSAGCAGQADRSAGVPRRPPVAGQRHRGAPVPG